MADDCWGPDLGSRAGRNSLPDDETSALLRRYFVSEGASAIGGGCKICGASVEGSWLSIKFLLIHAYWHENGK